MSQTESEPIFVQRACHDCQKQYVTTIIKIGNSFIPKESRCGPCHQEYLEYRREEDAHDAYMDKVYEDRLAQGLDPHTGEETDD